MKTRYSLLCISLAALALLSSARADTHIWTGLGASALWSDPHNWDNNTAPNAVEPAPCLLRFPPSAPQQFNTNDLAGMPIHQLRIEQAGYIVDLGSARLLGSVTLSSPFPGQARLYGQPFFAADISFDIGANLQLLTGADLGETSPSGLVKVGLGTLTLSGNNSFTGVVRINAGFVEVTSKNGLGTSDGGVVTDVSGGLRLVNVTIKEEPLTLAYGGPNGVGTVVAVGTNEWTGPASVVRDASITAVSASDEITFSGVLSGSYGLEMRGPGRVILAGDSSNTHDGTVIVSNGELRLAKKSLVGDPLDALTGPVFVGTPAGFPIAILRHVFDNQLFDKVNVTIRAGGRMLMDGHKDTIRALNFSDGGDASSGAAGLLEIGDDITAVASIPASAQISGHLSLGGASRSLLISNGMTLALHAAIEDGSGPAGLSKVGQGIAILDGANSYSGSTIVAEGVLTVAHNQGLGSAGVGTVVSNGASLNLDGNATIANETLTLNGPGYAGQGALSATNTETWTGPITLSSDSRIYCQGASELHISGVISGPGNLQKSGPGQLFLEGTQNNSFGSLLVSEGALLLNKLNALAVPSALTISDGATNASVRPMRPEQIADSASVTINALGVLQIINPSYETIAGMSGSGRVSFDFGTLRVGAFNTSATFTGQMLGVGNTNFIKIGTGSFQFLNNTNSHTGQTIVEAGTLRMDGVQQASLIMVGNSATLAGWGICGPVQVLDGAKLAPGSSPGRLTVGSVVFMPHAELVVDLEGTNSGISYDNLVVTGGQNLGNAKLRLNYAYAGTPGDTYVFLDNQPPNSINGIFAGLPEGAVFTTNGVAFRITYQGGTGNDVALTLLSPPQPAQITLATYVSGQAKLLATGTPGFTYNIEANEDLGNPNGWQLLGTAVPNGSGSMAFTDPDAVNHVQRFYRFVLP